jgi:hypothetical protein
MVFTSMNMFVVVMTIFEKDLFDQTALYEEGDGSINGCLGNSLLSFLEPQIELVNVKVVVLREDFLYDGLPFRGIP